MFTMVDKLQEMVARLAEQVQTLVRLEIQLAKSEVTDKAKTYGKAAAFGAAAGVLAFFAVFGLLIAAIWGLGELLPIWASALIVSALFLAVAGMLGLVAMRKAQAATPPMPEAAIANVRPLPAEIKQATS